MNFSFLLVIYIFVTIQLLNVCLVLFLTLLYIRTQRWLVLQQTSMSCWYRYITHFNLFHRLAFFVVQHIKGWSWHMPYAIYTFLLLTADENVIIISNCQQIWVGISDPAGKNKWAVTSLVLRSRENDPSTALEALPKPEDHKRCLPYCTFEYSSYHSQPCEHCTSQNISLGQSQASSFVSWCGWGWSAKDCCLQQSNICMRLTKPSSGDKVVIDVLQDCLFMPF